MIAHYPYGAAVRNFSVLFVLGLVLFCPGPIGLAIDQITTDGPVASAWNCEVTDESLQAVEATHLTRFQLLVVEGKVAEAVVYTSHLGGPHLVRGVSESSIRDGVIETRLANEDAHGDAYTYDIGLDPASSSARVDENFVYRTPNGTEAGGAIGHYDCSEAKVAWPENSSGSE